MNNADIPRRGFSARCMDALTTHTPTGQRFQVVFGEGAVEAETPEMVGV